MKLFRLFAQPNEYGCFDYDTYNSLVITADSEEQVDELLHNENFLKLKARNPLPLGGGC